MSDVEIGEVTAEASSSPNATAEDAGEFEAPQRELELERIRRESRRMSFRERRLHAD